ncbi:hypothetical protein FOCC_FOCC015430 [Frankliniella occidentalis]|nr:hypothetical protein FOCC_FOCC015430 [Frankliniella occidentalis]
MDQQRQGDDGEFQEGDEDEDEQGDEQEDDEHEQGGDGENEQGERGEDMNNPDEYVKNQLVEWTLEGGVTMNKVDDLLRRLHRVHPSLPLSYKTLLETPKNIEVLECGDGTMWYLGISPQLQRVLSPQYFDDHNDIAIDVNIDSVPIFSNSNVNFVPILGRLVDTKVVFIIGIYCGNGSDPSDLDSFFEKYVEDTNNLSKNGLLYRDQTFNFRVRHYILDQKARALVKCVKGVRGYYCCEKCNVRGVDFMNRMCLLEHDCDLRTDESFLDLAAALMTPRLEHADDDDEVDEHVTGLSPLLHCEKKLVSKFRLDSMHLVWKGVFLRWIYFLWNVRGDFSLTPQEKAEILDALTSLHKCCPNDFNRKPYAFHSVKKLKATELRRLALYDGLLLFRNLDHNIFKNFLLLHCGVFILCSEQFHNILNDEAKQFLVAFVEHAETIFGQQFIVYNVHSLVHMPKECLEHGPLDGFGAFPFENYLGMIKASVTSRVRPLQQVAKREMERCQKAKRNKAKPPPELLQMPRTNDAHEQVVGQQFLKIYISDTTFAINDADSCCRMNDDSIVILENIILSDNGPLVKGRKFLNLSDYYDYPIPSSLLGVLKVSQLDTILVARANATKSEFTSSLDTESEELGRHKRKRRARVISDLDDAVASVPHKKSSFPQPPTIAKSVVGNVKVKVGNSVRPSELPISSSSSANSQHILGKGKDCDGDGKAQNKALSSNENHSTVSVGKQHQKTGKEKKFCNNKDPVNNKKEASFSNSSYENPLNLVCAGSPHLKPGKDTTLSGAAVNNNRRETSQQNGALSLSTQEDEAEDDLSLHSGYEDSLYGDDLSSNIESPIQLCGKSHSSADLNEEQNKNKDETSKGLTKSANHKDETAKGTIKSANQTISKAEYVALLPLLAVINQRLATIERVQSSILRAVKPGQKLDLNVNNRFPLKNLDDFDSCEDYLSDKTNATEVNLVFSLEICKKCEVDPEKYPK